MLGLALPEFFPTTVANRRAALERIGPPRIVTGGERFEPFALPQGSLVPGARFRRAGRGELAIVDHAGATMVHATTRRVSGRFSPHVT